MKKITNLLLLLAVALFVACDDTIDAPDTLEVKPYYLAGTWQLAEVNGSALADDTYVYVVLDRKKGFKIYQNTSSMYPVLYTGTYELEYDWRVGDVISGVYDYGKGAWSNEYVITELYEESMVWTVKVDGTKDENPEVQKFVRIDKDVDKVPSHIVEAARQPYE